MVTLNNIRFLNAGYCRQFAYWTGTGKLSICKFQAVLVYFEHPRHGSFLIDTGYDQHFYSAASRFPFRLYRWLMPTSVDRDNCLTTALSRASINPAKLSGLFLSHFHPDHIGGLSALPRLPLILRRKPLDELRAMSSLQQLHHGFIPGLFDASRDQDIVSIQEEQFNHQQLPSDIVPTLNCSEQAQSLWPMLDYWNDGSLLLIDLPGHAMGHTGFIMNGPTGRLFYIVDATWNVDVLRSGKQLPWLARKLQPHYSTYWETQQKLYQLSRQNSQLTMLACHCPRTQSHVENSSH